MLATILCLCLLLLTTSAEEIPTLEQEYQRSVQPSTTTPQPNGYYSSCAPRVDVIYDDVKKVLIIEWAFTADCKLPRNRNYDFYFRTTFTHWVIVTGNTLTIPYSSSTFPDDLKVYMTLWTSTPNGMISGPFANVFMWRMISQPPDTPTIPINTKTTEQPILNLKIRQTGFEKTSAYIPIGLVAVCVLFAVVYFLVVLIKRRFANQPRQQEVANVNVQVADVV